MLWKQVLVAFGLCSWDVMQSLKTMLSCYIFLLSRKKKTSVLRRREKKEGERNRNRKRERRAEKGDEGGDPGGEKQQSCSRKE